MEERLEHTVVDTADARGTPRALRVVGGRYQVQALLGSGGMGSVFLARDTELDELVALKMLRGAEDSIAVERFRSEVRLARRVTHANVARTFDIGDHEGNPFITMEYIDGEALSARLDREGAMPISSFLRVAESATAGLAAAHDAGVVHRDLKPGNILLGRGSPGRVVLTDFGVAVTRAAVNQAELAGTPAYMAPEQFEGRTDERSDVYSLGLVLYRAVTGRRAFVTNKPQDRASLPAPPSDLRTDLPAGLSALITRCLEPDPARRFSSAIELASSVAEILAVLPPSVGDDTLFVPRQHSVFRDVQRAPRTILFPALVGDPVGAGLQHAVIDILNQDAVLRVTSDPASPHEVTAQLDLRSGEGGLELQVKLRGSREGFEFSSETFAGAAGDVLTIARAAAGGVARALATQLRAGDGLPPLEKAALDLYLAGRTELRGMWPAYLERARAAFDAALEIVPGHPLLLAALATARARQVFFEDCSVEDARAAGDLAVAAAPNLPEAHVARAIALHQSNDACGTMTEVLRALTLAPGLADAHAVLASLLVDAGSPSAALRAGELALIRDPSLALVRFEVARMHALLARWGDVDVVMQEAGRWVVSGVSATFRLRFALWRRDLTTMEEVLQTEASMPRLQTVFDLCKRALAGKTGDALGTDLLDKPGAPRSRTLSFQIATELNAFVGDEARALASLARAVECGLPDALWIDRCTLLDGLRGAPRFEALRDVVLGRAGQVRACFEATAT